jgi:hypothetical protein
MSEPFFPTLAPLAPLLRRWSVLASGLLATPLVIWIPADRLGAMSVKPSAYVGAILVASVISLALALVEWGSHREAKSS